jgi:hypothetical protein
VVTSLWLVSYTWFSSLPSLRLFGKMFPQVEENFLIRYPSLVKITAILNTVLCTLTTLVLIVIIPSIDPSRTTECFTAAMTAFSVFISMYCIAMFLITKLLIELFAVLQQNKNTLSPSVVQSPPGNSNNGTTAASPTITSSGSGGEANRRPSTLVTSNLSPNNNNNKSGQRGVENALLTIRAMNFLVVFAALLAVPFMLTMVWSPVARGTWYFFWSFLEVIALGVVLVMSYVFVVRMSQQNRTTRSASQYQQQQQQRHDSKTGKSTHNNNKGSKSSPTLPRHHPSTSTTNNNTNNV